MPRVIKHPEIRRAEILDEALRLFLERGYDNVSLNDLISEGGLSKGLFYHHFESKEALLEALFARICDETYSALAEVESEPLRSPLKELQTFFARSAEFCLAHAATTGAAFAAFLRPESELLYEGVVRACAERFRPFIVSIIQRGVDNGDFETFDVEGVARMTFDCVIGPKDLMTFGIDAHSSRERDVEADRLANRLRLHALALSRLLGLEDGSLSIGGPDFARQLFKLLNPQTGSREPDQHTATRRARQVR